MNQQQPTNSMDIPETALRNLSIKIRGELLVIDAYGTENKQGSSSTGNKTKTTYEDDILEAKEN